MPKPKHVHDTFKVSHFPFHTNQCNSLLLISHSKFHIHAYHNAPINAQILNHYLQNQKKIP